MKASFHYTVKAKLIRYIKNGEIDFIEFIEKFESQNPIEAREKAFNYYQNYIDVLLLAEGKKYHSDREARKYLTSFIDSKIIKNIQNGEDEDDFGNSFGNGIGVFMVIDESKPDSVNDDRLGDEIFIHGIGNISYLSDNTDSIIFELQHEYDYYKHFNYDTKNKELNVVYCSRAEWEEGYRDDEPSTYNILETPFDWEGFDEPYWWGKPNNEPNVVHQPPKTYEELINGGETNQVEFKPTLLYYYDKEGEKSGHRMFVRHIIAKVICSFLNSNGGNLFVGVGNNKEIQGLKDDFSLVRPAGKDPKDYFTLQVDKIIRDYFKSFASYISGEFTVINDIEIYVFIVFPSKNRPVFITGQNGKEFYVRFMGSCEPYTDIEQIAEYCIGKWGK